ncbi:hypothetical protein Tco_0103274 [Tanacetum coccineum]
MAQQIIPADQLVSTKYQSIKICNNYVVLQNIPCSPECKIVGKILLDHPLSYVLAATVDVPIVYLQQFWKTINKVPDTKDTIKFKLDRQEIVYTVDMFRSTLKLLMKTLENPFIAPTTMKVIKPFMQMVGYQGVVNKVSAFYTKFLAQPWETMFKVFNRCLTTMTSGHDLTKINILQIFHVVVNHVHVDYADLLWWDFLNCVHQKKDVIQYPRFTKLIIVDLMKKFPSIPQKIKEDYHSIKDDITLLVDGEDEELYASEFANSVFHDNDEDDSGNKIVPESHKENLEIIDDDDEENENEKEKKDDKKDEDDDKKDDKDKDNDDHTDHVLELTDTVSPSTATTSKDPHKKRHISSKCSHLPGALRRMCRRQGYMIRDMERKCMANNEFWKVHGKVDKVLHEIIPQIAERATNNLIEGNLKRVVADTIIQERDAFQAEVPTLISKEFATHVPKIIEELFKIHVQNNVIQVHPTTSSSTATTSSADL